MSIIISAIMNFLGHIYLSHGIEEITIGNFIGDFVKGNKHENYPPEIQKGILLHREIDRFTDHDEQIRASSTRLKADFGRYSAVVIDVFIDYLLATSWEKFHPLSLEEFSQDFFRIITKNKPLLPERVQGFVPHMIEHNWLTGYATLYGIERSLKGIDRRTSGDTELYKATEILEKHYTEFQAEFMEYFPRVIQHTKTFLGID